MVKLLKTRKKFSIAQLSERLEVSPRMIRKYKQDDYLNFPENRIWHAKKIVGLDKKNLRLGKRNLQKTFQHNKIFNIGAVYADANLIKLAKTSKKQAQQEQSK
jgi:transcriptional regulator with XRE-family HTH domain